MRWQALFCVTFMCFVARAQVVFDSEELKIQRVAPDSYVHISFLSTQSWGRVSCNGLVYISGGEAVIFDTPVNDSVSDQLISWIEKETGARIKAVVVTHFHSDCLGGLNAFHQRNIPSFSSQKTRSLAAADSVEKPLVPQNGFDKELTLKVGKQKVVNRFFGEGHTRDNIVSYIPSAKVLFGGCLIKESGAGKGNLADANTAQWSATVARIRAAYPEATVVIPGHGKLGGRELLDYTIELFQKDAAENR